MESTSRSPVLAAASKQRMDKHFPEESSSHSSLAKRRASRHYYIERRKDRAGRGESVKARRRNSAGMVQPK